MLTVTFPEPDELLNEIAGEVREATILGLRAGAHLVPTFLKMNFEAQGTRSGANPWNPISPRSLQYRQTRTAPDDVSPALVDTGYLMRSGEVGAMEVSGGVFAHEIALAAYGAGHDDGSAVTPDGLPVWQRPHMYIVDKMDTVKIDKAFEGAWQ